MSGGDTGSARTASARALVLALVAGASFLLPRAVAADVSTPVTITLSAVGLAATVACGVWFVRALLAAQSSPDRDAVPRGQHGATVDRSTEPVMWWQALPGVVVVVAVVLALCAVVGWLLVSGLRGEGGADGGERIGLAIALSPFAIGGIGVLAWAWRHRVPIRRRR